MKGKKSRQSKIKECNSDEKRRRKERKKRQ